MTVEALNDVSFYVEELRVKYDEQTGCLYPLHMAEMSNVRIANLTQGDEFNDLSAAGLEFSFGFETEVIKKLKTGSVTLKALAGHSTEWKDALVFYRYTLGSPVLMYATIPPTEISTKLTMPDIPDMSFKGHLRRGLVYNDNLIKGFSFNSLRDQQPTQSSVPPAGSR